MLASCNSGDLLQVNRFKSNKAFLSNIFKDDFRSYEQDVDESIQVIVQKYGTQWDFCDCVRKGDSLNKALQNPSLSEVETDNLLKRFEVIDQRCQAFKITDPNRTPRERKEHERKVKKCLSNY
jgi:hypothetical protein